MLSAGKQIRDFDSVLKTFKLLLLSVPALVRQISRAPTLFFFIFHHGCQVCAATPLPRRPNTSILDTPAAPRPSNHRHQQRGLPLVLMNKHSSHTPQKICLRSPHSVSKSEFFLSDTTIGVWFTEELSTSPCHTLESVLAHMLAFFCCCVWVVVHWDRERRNTAPDQRTEALFSSPAILWTISTSIKSNADCQLE